MKINRFEQGYPKTNDVYNIFVSTNENEQPVELSGKYKTYKDALKTIMGWIDNGFPRKIDRDNVKIHDAYIVKTTREILNNDVIKVKIASNKYNL